MKHYLYLVLAPILISINLYSQNKPGDLFPRDSIFFEYNTIPYQIDLSQPGNCWQVGHPAKAFFNGAYSDPLAIVTDTLLPYPVNNTSSFTFMIADSTNPPCYGASYFQFNHKYDMDTLVDYGYIEYSFDQGTTWMEAKDTTIMDGPNGPMLFLWAQDYSTSSGNISYHPRKITGHSDGWIVSRFVWQWLIPVKDIIVQNFDSIIVRFTFHSDNIQTNKEGWMVDNIITGCVELGSGVPTKSSKAIINISPNPMIEEAQVTFFEDASNASLEIYDILGRLIFVGKPDKDGIILLHRNQFTSGIFPWLVRTTENKIQTGKLVVK